MTIRSQARRVAELLRRQSLKVVFAESCTGGLVSGALTAVPGISQFHCGGLVVYRNETKQQYLDIPAELIERHGAVSEQVARMMAEAALRKTDEADISVSVTGHLGPDAPSEQDGLVHIAIARRPGSARTPICVRQFWCDKRAAREQRQQQTVEAVLSILADSLDPEKLSDTRTQP